MQLKQQKYLNNIVKQEHRFIKKRIRSMLRSKCFATATSIFSGVEAMYMIKKEQLVLRDQTVRNQKEFIHQLLDLQHKIRFR
ncbi:DDE-type integrase/transposase/recombinase [Bacillus mycoides]|nr:DDE domain-containing protein [Bacillus mycoides]QWI55826.1 DDE domain-containing protein [Bacillus mycoides]QWI92421.1 DDE-type integrase/transposase/recombinase [Bacillus mycoides]HDR7607465.1 DDE-type integrase/transposase/recombinase [Bacillus mycoides]